MSVPDGCALCFLWSLLSPLLSPRHRSDSPAATTAPVWSPVRVELPEEPALMSCVEYPLLLLPPDVRPSLRHARASGLLWSINQRFHCVHAVAALLRVLSRHQVSSWRCAPWAATGLRWRFQRLSCPSIFLEFPQTKCSHNSHFQTFPGLWWGGSSNWPKRGSPL